MPTAPDTSSTSSTAARLARTMAAATVGGGLTGLLVGGVAGRLAMRLLALTSPAGAQGGITDDEAVVGTVSFGGTVSLALFTLQSGAIGGLLLLLARRVLPPSRRARSLLSGLVAGAVGGAAFVHGHGSFDFTQLRPVWLAVVLFTGLPLLYGLLAPVVTDALDGWAHRAPLWLVLVAGVVVLVQPPTLVAVAIGFAVALAMATALPRWWRGRTVTVTGTLLLAALTLLGLYGLTVDVASLVQQQPPTAPLTF